MSIFEGVGVAVITPFYENEEVNYEEFAKQLEFLIANQADAIVVCGTTGEASTLSHEEHIEVIRFCVKQVNGRIPVIAGTGSNSTSTAIYLSQEAEKVGVDALLVVTPYYNKCTQKGLKEHFTLVANSVKIPILLYNIPGRTGGVNISPETVVSLVDSVENIVGVKDATGDFSQIAKLMALAKGSVDLYSGNDDQVLPLLSLGAKGVISVFGNIAPKETHDMCVKFFQGDVEGSRTIQLEALPLINTLFSEVNPIPVKKAMNLMGKKAGPLRRPLTEMEDSNAKNMMVEMKKYHLL
jgi:4-hydroxy-tetrahydrodipicolinate synthase